MSNSVQSNSAVLVHFTLKLDDGSTAESTRGNGKPALPAAAVGEEAKSRAVVARIMQIKRWEQRNRLPQSEVLEDQEFAAQIDNQHGYDDPQPA
ncbi:hypothetical protein A3N69_10355 [Klebsiella aerogenes]|nr:hypothetical protein A3N69_10355 [Klebsiella aerogenes]